MRKLAPVLGIALALVLLGCGGGGSAGSIPAMPHSLAEFRGEIKHKGSPAQIEGPLGKGCP